MKIEIYSDASADHGGTAAGFAHWISCYQIEVQHAGHIGKYTVAKAEMYAINHSIDFLLHTDLIPVERIDIYSDSTEAIHKIRNAKHNAFFSMIEFTIKNGMRARQVLELFHLHHIKAHTKCSSIGAMKNRWCDRMAKQYRTHGLNYKATIFDHSDILL